MYWCKYDKDTGTITGFSNTPVEDGHFFEITEQQYVDFREGTLNRDNFVVKFDIANKKHVLVPYEQEKPVFDVREIFVEVLPNKDAQCIIHKQKDQYKIYLQNTNTIPVLQHPNRLCKFSITRKDDPHLLLRTFDATVEQISNTHCVRFEDLEEQDEVSIYTPKVFDSYGVVND